MHEKGQFTATREVILYRFNYDSDFERCFFNVSFEGSQFYRKRRIRGQEEFPYLRSTLEVNVLKLNGWNFAPSMVASFRFYKRAGGIISISAAEIIISEKYQIYFGAHNACIGNSN